MTSGWLSMTLVLSLIWPTGAGNVAAHFLARSGSARSSQSQIIVRVTKIVFPTILFLAGVGSIISFLWLRASYGEVPIIGALVFGYCGWIYTRSLLMGLSKVKRAAFLDLISSATSVGFLLIIIFFRIDALLVGSLATGYLIFTIVAWFTIRPASEKPSAAFALSYREIAVTTSWNSLGLLASNGLIQFAMIYVVAVGSQAGAASFAVAMSLATPASMLAQALSQVLIPRFSHAAASGQEDSLRSYRVTLLVTGLILGAIFGIGVAVSPVVISVIYGNSYSAASSLMQILLVAMYFYSLCLIASSYLLSTHRVVVATLSAAGGSVVGLIIMLSFISEPTMIARMVALGVLVGYGLACIAAVVFSLAKRTHQTSPVAVISTR